MGKDKKATKGAKTFFNVSVRADPLPTVQWYLNGEEIKDDDTFKISFKEDEHLYRLDVLDCQSNTAGEIKVVAKNENGEDMKVVAKAKAFPFADATWYKVITAGPPGENEVEKIDFAEKEWSRFSASVEENGLEATYTLNITDATLEDACTFELSLANRVGHMEAQGSLNIVTEEPSFPQALGRHHHHPWLH